MLPLAPAREWMSGGAEVDAVGSLRNTLWYGVRELSIASRDVYGTRCLAPERLKLSFHPARLSVPSWFEARRGGNQDQTTRARERRRYVEVPEVVERDSIDRIEVAA